jgi:hypothetical protein
MTGTLDLRHLPRIAPESARTLDQPSAANPPASRASAPWWSGQSGGRSQNGVDRPVADRGVSDVIWPTGRVAGGGTWFGGRTQLAPYRVLGSLVPRCHAGAPIRDRINSNNFGGEPPLPPDRGRGLACPASHPHRDGRPQVAHGQRTLRLPPGGSCAGPFGATRNSVRLVGISAATRFPARCPQTIGRCSAAAWRGR